MGLGDLIHQSRREFCATAALGALSLFPGKVRGDEVKPDQSKPLAQLSTYSAPKWDLQLTLEEVASKPVAVSQRYESPAAGIYTCKVFIGDQGDLYVRSFQNIQENGWLKKHREDRSQKPGQLRNPVAGDPDIRPSTGSGVMLEFVVSGEKKRFVLSNDHVVTATRRELEEKRCSLHNFDVTCFPASQAIIQEHDRARIPLGAICADPQISNRTLSSKKVRIFGLGADLYNFVGQPFPIRALVREEGSPPKEIELFGLRVADNFFKPIGQMGGMSGSPVMLDGTHEVVGTVCRSYSRSWQGKELQYVVFSPIDALRELEGRLLAGLK